MQRVGPDDGDNYERRAEKVLVTRIFHMDGGKASPATMPQKVSVWIPRWDGRHRWFGWQCSKAWRYATLDQGGSGLIIAPVDP
jgi:hypothetical protein